ncbi:mitochondrial import inner membrane translocase subunit Tim17 family protein [Neohortaea acidophila]|uniref:Mitochondrial import inner membrane translocase subunit Tim17 family protein n=1 Tax=Neohortaea acidophila TaxID=245834 RepID=A0A6A6PQK3_9PEZI|nr:mitochondrial import inner membrane translocase subunit Tim17 family protein [Neohortaea acidophila]KAF2481961.1 mitochondrial import inner membrane translocase subunit Tim17 family protein [Neohortaea acidophila]
MASYSEGTETQGSQDVTYHPKDAVGSAVKATGITGGAGLFISAIQNTLSKQNVGAFGVFTRTGGTIAVFAAMGGAYEFTKCASANLREKDDTLNPTIGGFVAGSMLGLRFRSLPAVLGYGAMLATTLGVFNYTGGKLTAPYEEEAIDRVGEKERMRKARRRPVEETVHELGEGRGVYAPGYAQRRADRIREAYGIDVTKPTPAVHPAATS